MGRIRSATRGVVALSIGASLAAGFLVPAAAPPVSAAGQDKAEVVLVLDFSASILNDKTNRNRFGAALERIADRVEETSRDLITGDATVTIVQFASRAADVNRCTDLKLFGSPSTVRRFADCLRDVAAAYRKGLDPALTKAIGNDTNYVAAMERAATHLPADAVRPTLILFSDGKHDVAGVPVREVPAAQERLFGDRAPFALLPVGMGLDPADRADLEAGLLGLRTIREMPACASGTTFEWPQVVFQSPDDAGTAVAVALQNATCTFTVAPTPVPTASPTPQPTPSPSTPTTPPSAPGKPAVEAMNGAVKISVPADAAAGPAQYRYECSPDSGTSWPADAETDAAAGGDTGAIVVGLTNGATYVCRAFASNDGGTSDASPLSDAVRPCGTFLECLGVPIPVVLGVVGAVLAAAILLALFALLPGRRRGYVVAVVDVVHSANLGGGSTFGIAFERRGREVEGIAAARGSTAEVRIRKLRGDRFRVQDKRGAHTADSGEAVVIVDSHGVRHELVLRAFTGKAASAVSARR